MPAGKLRWCQANANRCWRWASETTNHEYRQAFLAMARKWSGMALIEERRSVLRPGYRTKPSTPDQRRSAGLSQINVSVEAA